MADEPAESDDLSVHAGCREVDRGPTAGFERAASFSGPRARMQMGEEPLLARKGCSPVSMDENTVIEALARQIESRVCIQIE